MKNPLGKPLVRTLSPWQNRQAAMLYHFASMDYLKGLHHMVTSLIVGEVEPLVTLAKTQGRDSVLIDPRWGTRNTVENWSNNAWPFLKELQSSLAKDISKRALERYQKTAVNECFRGLREFSMQWATAEEEQRFEEALEIISAYSGEIDATLDDYCGISRWKDNSFTCSYQEFRAVHKKIPRFQIRTDVTAESGKTPRRTGVYISQDDPNAALQFAWTGNGGGKLRAASTFNEIGLAALQSVGRKDLWLDDEKMFAFATSGKYDELFRPTIYMLGEEHRDFASMAVAKEAFINRPDKWYLVEIINGEFENLDEEPTLAQPEIVERIAGGQICTQSGFYFTPALPGSRQRFVKGTKVPDFKTEYGETFWQWDPRQE